MSDKTTISVYDARAHEYAKAFDGKKIDAELRAFMDAVATGGSVLDLGCGTGGASIHLVENGFEVTGTDASKAMLAIAASRINGQFRHETFDDLTDSNLYDGVWANFSLLHAPREKFPVHLAQIKRALRSNGVFHVGLKSGSGSSRDAIDRMYTFWEQSAVEVHLQATGFEVIKATNGSGVGLAGTDDPWFTLLAKRLD